MGNIFNTDFQDFIQSLNKAGVKYILVGGYSVILHGYSRTTGDMDLLVACNRENYTLLQKAFADFGMPTFDMTEDRFLDSSENDVFTFGRQPSAIDIMTKIKGASFPQLYANAADMDIDGLTVKTVSLKDLLLLKSASGRSRDKDDLEHLS